MVQKKKKKKASANSIAFMILLMALALVWLLSSCTGEPTKILENFTQGDELQDPQDSGQETDQPAEEQPEQETAAQAEEAVQQLDAPEESEAVDETDEPTQAELTDEAVASQEEAPADTSLGDNYLEGDGTGLSNTTLAWSFKRNDAHEPVTGYTQGLDLAGYGAYYKVDTEEKVIYLTFDEGYENGYTSRILDILKDNDVQAAFFVTEPYIESESELCTRMKAEGHIVGNHTSSHPSLPDLTQDAAVIGELTDTRTAFEEATGYEMDPFFRFPKGEYSERTLYLVRSQGYRSIFCSLAMMDWDTANQPGADYVYEHLMANHHPGGIFLLHAVSQSVTDALDESIKALKAEGYRFGSLYEVE